MSLSLVSDASDEETCLPTLTDFIEYALKNSASTFQMFVSPDSSVTSCVKVHPDCAVEAPEHMLTFREEKQVSAIQKRNAQEKKLREMGYASSTRKRKTKHTRQESKIEDTDETPQKEINDISEITSYKDICSLNVVTLKRLLKEKGLGTVGSKKELLTELLAHCSSRTDDTLLSLEQEAELCTITMKKLRELIKNKAQSVPHHWGRYQLIKAYCAANNMKCNL